MTTTTTPRADARPETGENPALGQGLSYAPYLHVSDGLVSGDGFATLEAVQAAAALLPPTDGTRGSSRTVYGVEVGPGVLRLKTTTTGLYGDLHDDPPERGEIVEWSGKSRVRMVRTLCSLDWAPVIDAGTGWRPVMVTLTLPGGWTKLAPDGPTFKRLLERFYERWRRAHGRAWSGVWKLEFQRRGAPHVHLYCAAPVSVEGEDFREWLSRTWAGAVHGLRIDRREDEIWPELLIRVHERYGLEVMKHVQAGTGVDWGEGMRASDPKRLGIYFAKRASAHNVADSKEYQHVVPDEWRGEGRGPGRFWGYRGLERATEDVELSEEDWHDLRRLMRRWARAQDRPVRSLETGRVQGGFLLHNDAPRWVAQASRWWIGPAARRAPSGRVTGPLDSTRDRPADDGTHQPPEGGGRCVPSSPGVHESGAMGPSLVGGEASDAD